MASTKANFSHSSPILALSSQLRFPSLTHDAFVIPTTFCFPLIFPSLSRGPCKSYSKPGLYHPVVTRGNKPFCYQSTPYVSDFNPRRGYTKPRGKKNTPKDEEKTKWTKKKERKNGASPKWISEEVNATHLYSSLRKANPIRSVYELKLLYSCQAKAKKEKKKRRSKLKIQRKDRVRVNSRRVVLFALREKKNCLRDDMGSGLFWGCDENGRKSTERLAGEGESGRPQPGPV